MPEFTPSRRSVIRTAAWSVPAVTVATAAPAFAASPDPTLPNLSTSTSGTTPPTRNDNYIVLSASTLTNTGGTEANGVVVRFESSAPIQNLQLDIGVPLDPGSLGIAVTGLGTTTVQMTVPPSGASAGSLLPPGESWTSPASQRLTFADSNPVTLTVTATAVNGGVPFTPPEFTV